MISLVTLTELRCIHYKSLWKIVVLSGAHLISLGVTMYVCLGFIITLRPRQNGRHFADDIFNCIFLNEDTWISLNISLKFVAKGQINNIPASHCLLAHYLQTIFAPFERPHRIQGQTQRSSFRDERLCSIFYLPNNRCKKYVHDIVICHVTIVIVHATVLVDHALEAMRQVENEDVVGAGPTGDAPTTSEWSTTVLPTKVSLKLEILR